MNTKYTVVGIYRFHYKSKKGSSEFDAVYLYCTYPRERVSGVVVEAFFLRADALGSGIDVGSSVRVFYNRRGFVDAVVRA